MYTLHTTYTMCACTLTIRCTPRTQLLQCKKGIRCIPCARCLQCKLCIQCVRCVYTMHAMYTNSTTCAMYTMCTLYTMYREYTKGNRLFWGPTKNFDLLTHRFPSVGYQVGLKLIDLDFVPYVVVRNQVQCLLLSVWQLICVPLETCLSHFALLGKVFSWACSHTLMCCTGVTLSQAQHTLSHIYIYIYMHKCNVIYMYVYIYI